MKKIKKLSPEVFWWIGLSLSVIIFLLICIFVDSIKNIGIVLAVLLLGLFAGLSISSLIKIKNSVIFYPMKRISSDGVIYYTKVKVLPSDEIRIMEPNGSYRRLTKKELFLFEKALKNPKQKGPEKEEFFVMDYSTLFQIEG